MRQDTAKYLLDHVLEAIEHLSQVEYWLSIEEHTAESNAALDARSDVVNAMDGLHIVREALDKAAS